MAETNGKHRFYHCEMLIGDIEKRDKHGDTRASVFIDDAEARILIELLQAELIAIRQIDPEAATYWDKHKEKKS